MVLRAHVENGQIVLDEPASLPEGATLELRVIEAPLSAGERAAIEAEVDAGVADFERGEAEDALAFARRLLRARSCLPIHRSHAT